MREEDQINVLAEEVENPIRGDPKADMDDPNRVLEIRTPRDASSAARRVTGSVNAREYSIHQG